MFVIKLVDQKIGTHNNIEWNMGWTSVCFPITKSILFGGVIHILGNQVRGMWGVGHMIMDNSVR